LYTQRIIVCLKAKDTQFWPLAKVVRTLNWFDAHRKKP
jgi:hypothetical protein